MVLSEPRVRWSVQGGAFVSYEPIEWTSFEASEFDESEPERLLFLDHWRDPRSEGRSEPGSGERTRPASIAAFYAPVENEPAADPISEELW